MDTSEVIVRLDLSYDGKPFKGWAIQPNLLTVQGAIEDALEVLFGRFIRIVVAGRTDTGVHARGQVVSFSISDKEWFGLCRGKDIQPEESLRRRLMGILSMHLQNNAKAIVINRVSKAPEGFNARFSALWRRYSYRIIDNPQAWDPLQKNISWWLYRPLDIDAMNEGAKLLLGRHDFIAYCKPRPGTTTVRTLQEFSFERHILSHGFDYSIAENSSEKALIYQEIKVKIRADAFCHNMVRALIAATVRVGLGEQEPKWLKTRLDAQRKDKYYSLAPAHPLILEEVAYPEDKAVFHRAEKTRALREGSVR